MTGTMPLTMVSEGQNCTVYSIEGKTSISTRLRELGFIAQTPVRVLRADGGGLIISVNGSRLALSRGLASRIIVSC